MTRWFEAHTIRQFGRYRQVEPIVVVEVAFDVIQRSSRHQSGFALRFPRIVGLRTDKSPTEIDTLATVERLYRDLQHGAEYLVTAEVEAAASAARGHSLGTGRWRGRHEWRRAGARLSARRAGPAGRPIRPSRRRRRRHRRSRSASAQRPACTRRGPPSRSRSAGGAGSRRPAEAARAGRRRCGTAALRARWWPPPERSGLRGCVPAGGSTRRGRQIFGRRTRVDDLDAWASRAAA